jgi:hypothetical protein
MNQQALTRYRETLVCIAERDCEASVWAEEVPPVRDRCLDPDYIEGEVEGRCPPCAAFAALVHDADVALDAIAGAP